MVKMAAISIYGKKLVLNLLKSFKGNPFRGWANGQNIYDSENKIEPRDSYVSAYPRSQMSVYRTIGPMVYLFSFILAILINMFTALKGSQFIFISYYCSWCCAVWRP